MDGRFVAAPPAKVVGHGPLQYLPYLIASMSAPFASKASLTPSACSIGRRAATSWGTTGDGADPVPLPARTSRFVSVRPSPCQSAGDGWCQGRPRACHRLRKPQASRGLSGQIAVAVTSMRRSSKDEEPGLGTGPASNRTTSTPRRGRAQVSNRPAMPARVIDTLMDVAPFVERPHKNCRAGRWSWEGLAASSRKRKKPTENGLSTPSSIYLSN